MERCASFGLNGGRHPDAGLCDAIEVMAESLPPFPECKLDELPSPSGSDGGGGGEGEEGEEDEEGKGAGPEEDEEDEEGEDEDHDEDGDVPVGIKLACGCGQVCWVDKPNVGLRCMLCSRMMAPLEEGEEDHE
jgi:hypothetical protein